MNANRPKRARGQAMVELAIGSVVFVTVLLLGIQFAELGVVELRVQQAGMAGLWDATARRLHSYSPKRNGGKPQFLAPGGKGYSGSTVETVEQKRFKDFDASKGAGNGYSQSGMRLAIAQGSRLTVRCDNTEVYPWRTNVPRFDAVLHSAGSGGREADGIACNARAETTFPGMPKKFLEGTGEFFKVPLVKRAQIPLCAFGRNSGGKCGDGVPIMLDDWALSGSDAAFGRELEHCVGNCRFGGNNAPGNVAYRNLTEHMFNSYSSAALRSRVKSDVDCFVSAVVSGDYSGNSRCGRRQAPVDVTEFAFAFEGEEGAQKFRVTVREGATTSNAVAFGVDTHWATTPYSDRYQKAYGKRDGCFAGSSCKNGSSVFKASR